MIELGACLASLAGHGLAGALRRVHAEGLTVVDLPVDRRLGLVDPQLRPDSDACAELVEAVAAAGVRVAAVSESTESRLLLGPYDVLAGDRGASVAAAREHAIAVATRAIELAAAFGAPYARLFLGCPDFARWLTWHDSDATWADNVAEFAERIAPLLDLAATRGVRVVLEPHPKQVAYDLASITAVLDALPGRIDICIDPANLLALGHDPVAVVRALPVVPAMVQAKDVERARDAVPVGPGWVRYGPQPAVRFRAAGWGEVDWRRLLTALAEREYAGDLLIEHEDLLSSPEDGLAAAAGFLRPLAATVSVGNRRTW